MIRVWDLVVRLFHRGLAACFALAWLTAEEAQGAHEWLGYGAAMSAFPAGVKVWIAAWL
ncbi:hypothetical protein SAMN05878503_10247 [Cereibacter ovatus]|uniref:Uncharacterized protein n=1 Tax=Cereibacter ovatus TaxID=439529 RepID=A0A285CL53_9RHOB|nr:hypothetical protein [Cereibacter ovatus]SNX68287.1 hypothetical protein SAMN05878503_10247 [Cereibacter ovatus]